MVGRPGLEPVTYGLKVDRLNAEPYRSLSQCVALSVNAVFKMSKNAARCCAVPDADEHLPSKHAAGGILDRPYFAFDW